MRPAPDTHPAPTSPSGAGSDFANLLRVIRRMTVAEWTHGIACVAIIAAWTIYVVTL